MLLRFVLPSSAVMQLAVAVGCSLGVAASARSGVAKREFAVAPYWRRIWWFGV